MIHHTGERERGKEGDNIWVNSRGTIVCISFISHHPPVYLPPTSVYFSGSYIACGATIVYISFISHHPLVYLPPTSVYFSGSYIECGATIVYISFISHHPPVYLPWFSGIAEPHQKSPHYKEQVCVIAMSCARLYLQGLKFQ